MAGRPSLRASAQVRLSVRQHCSTGRRRNGEGTGSRTERRVGETPEETREGQGGGAAGAWTAQAGRRAGGTEGGGGA